jgi:hypothetical protein
MNFNFTISYLKYCWILDYFTILWYFRLLLFILINFSFIFLLFIHLLTINLLINYILIISFISFLYSLFLSISHKNYINLMDIYLSFHHDSISLLSYFHRLFENFIYLSSIKFICLVSRFNYFIRPFQFYTEGLTLLMLPFIFPLFLIAFYSYV